MAADSPGRVAVWSPASPEHPLWSVDTASCVTSLDFASQAPGLLAVGAYDGSLLVFDLKSKQVRALTCGTGRQGQVWPIGVARQTADLLPPGGQGWAGGGSNV